MKVFTRYLLRSHVGPFFFAFGALTGIILVNTLAKELASLAGRGLSFGVIAEFFFLSLPSNIALTFPMSVLVAVLYTFSALANENEFTALRASGVDLRRVVLPLLAAGAVVTAGMVFFNDRVLPESNHQWKQLMLDVARKSPVFALEEHRMNLIPSDGGRRFYLQARTIVPAANRLLDVTIYDLSEPQLGRTIYADSGRMAFNDARTDLLLTLFDGYLREVDIDQPSQFQRLQFSRQMISLPGVGDELERQQGAGYRGDREMTIGMLKERISELERELDETRERAGLLALSDLERTLGEPAGEVRVPAGRFSADAARELASLERQVRSLERQTREYGVEVHKKYAIAAAALVFVLVGAPLALRFPAGGVGMVIAVSLLVFALYYVGLIGGEALGDAGLVHPAISMWAMNGVFGAVGLAGLWRMGRESFTGRGGDGGSWKGELWGALRIRMPRRAA
ncbi:MAG: LptF/LptG family permease [Longimicrobiaceae bacterium]